MAIGSTYNHPADVAANLATAPGNWAARFPNPPDLCFDYRKLVEQVGGIAKANLTDHRICIIGAGVTGLTAARELLRCGFTQITLIEQSQRVGGRHTDGGEQPSIAENACDTFRNGRYAHAVFQSHR